MDEQTLSIRPAVPADVEEFRQLCIETFVDTYNVYNTPENMQLYINTHYTPQRVLDEINSSTMQFYLAVVQGKLVGYVKMRTTDNPPQLAGKKHIEIERIYVLPGYKGLKIGKSLIAHATIVAREQQFEVLWLGVWEKNEHAMAFYTKQGFTVFGEHDFILGTDRQKDWLMKLELV